MPIPESIQIEYTNEVPLAPRINQDGVIVTATSVASVPFALPGEKGDIMTIKVKGDYDVSFKFVSSASGRASAASESVFAKTKELFLTPTVPFFVSVISPDGNSVVIINTHARGT